LLDTLTFRWRELTLRKDPECPVCGANPSITELIDYDAFCGVGSEPENKTVEIGAKELEQEIGAEANLLVVDVREPHEWEIGHIDGSVLIPLGQRPS
jgi:adenylyltransferase/sulfurtransferase